MFVGLPRPTDIAIDGGSRLYVASWKGGQYRYGGEQIGYLARLTPTGAAAPQIPDIKGANDARLVDLIASANQVHRRFAQHELVRRGPTPERIALLEKRIAAAGPLPGACGGDLYAESSWPAPRRTRRSCRQLPIPRFASSRCERWPIVRIS